MGRAITRGQRLLLALCNITTRAEIAARCDVSLSCVSEWLSGDARPSQRAAERLESIYGIKLTSWSTPHTA
jgi:ribosome-binding protein aMBF1 (putative translation factor)